MRAESNPARTLGYSEISKTIAKIAVATTDMGLCDVVCFINCLINIIYIYLKHYLFI